MRSLTIGLMTLLTVAGCSKTGSQQPDYASRPTTEQPVPVTPVGEPAPSPSPEPVQEDTGREGGGGGGIRIDGRVYTFSEMGLKLERPDAPYFPDFETIEATQKALDRIEAEVGRLPRRIIHDGVFSNRHEYKKVNVVDPALFARMKLEYQDYLESLGTNGTFVLAAYTSGGITYLFPDFFAADVQARAIYLIHESAYFLKPQSELIDVLGFEIAVSDFLSPAPPAPTDLQLMQRKIAVTDGLYNLGLINRETSLAFYLHRVMQKYPGLTAKTLIGGLTQIETMCRSNASPEIEATFETDAAQLNDGIRMEPSFLTRFYRLKVKFKSWDIDSCKGDFSASALPLRITFDSLTGVPKFEAVAIVSRYNQNVEAAIGVELIESP